MGKVLPLKVHHQPQHSLLNSVAIMFRDYRAPKITLSCFHFPLQARRSCVLHFFQSMARFGILVSWPWHLGLQLFSSCGDNFPPLVLQLTDVHPGTMGT